MSAKNEIDKILTETTNYTSFESQLLFNDIYTVNYYGIELIYNKNFPEYFLLDKLIKQCKMKQALEKFKFLFTSKLSPLRELLKQENLNINNTCIYEIAKENNNAKYRYCTSKIFWAVLFWNDIELFTTTFFKRLFNIDLFTDLIEYKIFKNNKIHNKKLINVKTIVDIDSMINFNDFVNNFRLKTDIFNCNRIKIKDEPYLSILEKIKVNFNKNSEEYKRNGKRQLFVNINVCFLCLAIKEKLVFWYYIYDNFNIEKFNILRNYKHENNKSTVELIKTNNIDSITPEQKEEFLNADKDIDLRRLLTNKLNDNFGICEMENFKILFHLKTSYIHARYLAKQVNQTKATHLYRYFQDEKTAETIVEFNKKKGCSNFGLTDENDKKLDLVSIDEQLKNNVAYFELINVENEFKGYYFHPEFFVDFITWFDRKLGLKYNEFLTTEIYCLSLENKTILEEQQKLIEEIRKENEALKQKLIQYDSLKDSIKIKQLPNGKYHLSAKSYNQVKTNNSDVIEDLENVKKFNEYIYNNISKNEYDFIKTTDKKHFYTITNIEKVKDLIISLAEEYNKIYDSKDNFKFNEAEYNKRLENYNKTNSPKSKGFLFESLMSKKYNANLWKDKSDEFVKKFNVPNEDVGIDLIDEKNKIVYQCKYVKTICLSEQLKRTLNIFEKIKSIDDSYKLVLLCSNESNLSKTIEMLYKNNIIKENIEF